MSFAVVRHPDIEALGIIPEGALESQRARGWYRVSPWANEPFDLHPPDYADVHEDLDAPPPAQPKAKPATTDEEQR